MLNLQNHPLFPEKKPHFLRGFLHVGCVFLGVKPRTGVLGRKNFAGFVRGVGRGLAGSVLKPVSKFGEAISDMGSGAKQQVVASWFFVGGLVGGAFLMENFASRF